MAINKTKFFESYRNYFPGKLNQSQVDGLSFLLKKLDESKVFNYANEYAYILSTIKHECAEKWKPVTEYGPMSYLQRKKYYPFIGRGYVQLTWDFNYEKFGKILNIDLIGQPDLALEPETSWKILELGMSKGLFTGHSLFKYVNSNQTDYYNARRVINGIDRAGLLKSYAESLYNCIEF